MASIMKIRKLYAKVRSTNKAKAQAALAELRSVNEEMRSQANKQYRDLRRSSYNYGNAYDYATGYIQTRYGGNAVSFYKEKTADDIYAQSLVLVRLLNDPMFSVAGLRAQENKRFAAFKESGLDLVGTLGRKDAREFLRFLGNSGASDYLDVFSAKNSWQALEMLFDIFNESEEYRERLNDVFNEFKLYLETMQDEEWRGMTYTQVRSYVEKTYEDIAKRRR